MNAARENSKCASYLRLLQVSVRKLTDRFIVANQNIDHLAQILPRHVHEISAVPRQAAEQKKSIGSPEQRWWRKYSDPYRSGIEIRVRSTLARRVPWAQSKAEHQLVGNS